MYDKGHHILSMRENNILWTKSLPMITGGSKFSAVLSVDLVHTWIYTCTCSYSGDAHDMCIYNKTVSRLLNNQGPWHDLDVVTA